MSHPCIGIDLGTTYSALATINPAGKPEIVPNAEGERLTSVLSLTLLYICSLSV